MSEWLQSLRRLANRLDSDMEERKVMLERLLAFHDGLDLPSCDPWESARSFLATLADDAEGKERPR